MSSCKEDIDNQIPVIEISSPFEGQEYFIPDSIHVLASISDDNNVKSLQVGLVNTQFVSVIPIVYLFPESTNYELEIELPIIGNDIETGNYYVYIRAEDENNFKNKYQSIHITGVPKVLEKIIVLTYKGTTKIGVSAVDAESNVVPLFEVTGDYASSETDSKNRLLYIAGHSTFDIQTYDLDTKEIVWQRDAFPPLPVHENNCFYFDEHLYASYASYYIYGFRYNGSMVFNTTIEESKLPSRIMKFQDFLVADLQSKTGGFSYIATYYASTGVEKQRIQTNYKVVDFHDAGENRVLVIGNENDEGVVWQFDPYLNTQIFLKNVAGKILCSVKLANDDYLIGTLNSVFLFTTNFLTLEEILPGTVVNVLRYDPVNQKIYAAGVNQIFIYNYPEIKIQNAITISDGILNMHLFYNR